MVEFSTNLIASGGLVGVFLLMVLENLFPPIPSEVIMPLAGFTAARGQMSILGVVLAGTLGSIAGNAVWFELARAFGTARTRRAGRALRPLGRHRAGGDRQGRGRAPPQRPGRGVPRALHARRPHRHLRPGRA